MVRTGEREGRNNQSNTASYWCVICTGAERVWTFSGEVLSSVHGLPTEVVHHVVHHGLVSEEDGTDYFVVDDLGAVPRYWSHAPQQEETLDHREQKDIDDYSNTMIL